MKFFKIYLVTFFVFLLIDLVWLTLVANSFYKNQIGHLLAKTPNLIPALIFYLLFIVGLVIFVIQPGLVEKNLVKTIFLGGLFGLISYATYDLTNMATLKNWPLLVTVVDMVWGTFLGAVTSSVSFIILSWMR